MPFHIVLMLLLAACVLSRPARADDVPVFSVDLRDGAFIPDHLVVPANTRIKIVLRNIGSTPAEFESIEQGKEKVLAPGAGSFIIIRSLPPGEHPFFDEFHPDSPPVILLAQ